MTSKKSFFCFSLLLLCILGCILLLRKRPAESLQSSNDDRQCVITHHTANINGSRLSYTVTAGETYIYDLNGNPTASIYSYAYVKSSEEVSRPVVFVFNGGPGSSSLWTQLGIGTYCISPLNGELIYSQNGSWSLSENQNSILDVADLVFIDPVGTGYSHAVGNASDSDFYNVSADADSIARFIRQWVNEHNRWSSPKYLMGESYGCTRAAVLADALMGGPTSSSGELTAIPIDGIIMMGVSLQNDSTVDELLSDALALPSMASAAWYYQKSESQSSSLEEVYEEAKQYAEDIYYPALQKEQAGTLSMEEKTSVIQKLCGFTGLSKDTFEDSLMLDTGTFSENLLSGDGQTIGIYDARYTLLSEGSQSEPVADDPAMSQYAPAFISGFQELLKSKLRAAQERPYNALVWKNLNLQWDYEENRLIPSQGYEYDLAAAMRRNPSMRLFVASGYYDLATPAALAEHIIANAPIDSARVNVKRYASGHMIYIGSAKDTFLNDLRAFLDQ